MEVDPEKIFTFHEGIPGLKGITKYFLVESDDLAPFKWLQACEPARNSRPSDPYLSLMMLDPIFIDPQYHVNIPKEHADSLKVEDSSDLFIQSLIVVPQDPKDMTANLLAPLVFNKKSRLGMQIVIEGNRNLLRVKVIQD